MLRSDFDQVLARNVAFVQDDVTQGVLLHVSNLTDLNIPSVKPLEQWDFPAAYKAYMDACIAREQAAWACRGGLHCDTIPTMKPYYGIAEHSALLGGTVVYGGDTSYHVHPLEDWDTDFDKLCLSEENENLKLLLDSMKYLKSKEAEVGFLASLRGGEAPMDMANAIRGNDLFYDLYDEPERVHALIQLCLQASRFTFRLQKEIVGEVCGGVMSGFGVWLPGNSIGHLSEDASSMCNVEMYREFGKPYLAALLDDYDCTLLHVHTMGLHVLPEFVDLDKIKFIQLTYDPNQTTPIQAYKQNAALLQNKIVVLDMRPDEVEENLSFLYEHKSIVCLRDATLAQAEHIAHLVRAINQN